MCVCMWVGVCMNDNVFVCIRDMCGGMEEGKKKVSHLCVFSYLSFSVLLSRYSDIIDLQCYGYEISRD